MANKGGYRAIQRFSKGNNTEKVLFMKDLVSGQVSDTLVTKFELINVIEWALGKISLDEDDGK